MKQKKIITSLVLAILCIVLSAQPAFAAEGEVWYKGQQYSASYTVTNNNLTPYKVINASGCLRISGSFCKADSASYSNVRLTVEIREYGTGRVLNRCVVDNTSYPNRNSFLLDTDVSAGQKIQIYFDVSSVSNPPGPYRKASVDYVASFIR